MLILALAATLVLPNVSRGLRSTAVRKVVRETAALMTHLRQEALREGSIKELVIASEAGREELVWEGGRFEIPEQARFAGIEGGWQDADGTVHVLFYPSGGGTGVRLWLEGSGADGPSFLVSADPLLGTVKVERAQAQ